MSNDDTTLGEAAKTRYEFRVWGRHRKARKELARLADERTTEYVEDCYLISDDPSWNAKVRDETLKLKHLVDSAKGFEEWASRRFRTADETPSPYDELFEALRLDRPARGKRWDIETAVERLDPELGIEAIFVEKERVRYRIGSIRAEATDIVLVDRQQTLHTLLIEGGDLDELVALRKQLGLKGEDNIAVHQAIAEAA